MSFHIAAKKGEIADTVLLPGDPLRAKFMAETFLEDVNCYNEVRNMFGFTGRYKGKMISIQGTGMGIPSTSIYVNELIEEYGVKTLIRVGTCGSIRKEISPGDIILAMSAGTDSNINKIKFDGMDFAPTADFELLDKAYRFSLAESVEVKVGPIFSTDSFYHENPERYHIWREHGVIAVEMESSILYTLAAKANARALSVLTVSDNLVTNKFISAEDREKKIEDVTRIALEISI